MKHTTENVKNWGQALDWTWSIKWKRTKAASVNKINSNHVTNYCGRALPLARMGKAGWWMEFQAELQDQGRNSSTINRIISAGTTVMRYTHHAGLHNVPVPKFERLKEGEQRLTWFSKEDISKLAHIALDVYGRQDLADAIVFSAYTGLRQSEFLNLRATDIDWKGQKIWVGGIPEQFVTKGRECRGIPIHPLVAPIIEPRLENKFLFGDDWDGKDQLWYAFKKVRDYAGFSDRHVWHSLRHSFGTFLGEVTHPRQIMELLGHKQIETSLRYVKVTDEATQKAVLAI